VRHASFNDGCADVSEQFALEHFRFTGCCHDPQGQAAEHESRRQLVGDGSARLTEPPTAVEQPADGQSAQLLAELVWRGDDHGPQLPKRLAADVDGASASEQQQPQRFTSVAGSWQRQRAARQRRPRRTHRVECVILAAQSALAPSLAATSSTVSPRSPRKRVRPAP
jgi:hypothetical protein